MNLKLYNSLSSKKETFRPLSNKRVKTYGCGPTVYNDPHIGNFRTFVFYDLLNRVLKMNGYNTVTAVNITDIDDKIIDAANENIFLIIACKYKELSIEFFDTEF